MLSGTSIGNFRKRLSKQARHLARIAYSGNEYRRVYALKDRFAGMRCFLLANGPSLRQMDLSPLKNEHVCLVNMGIRAFEQGLPSATFHMITDNNRYRRFAEDCESYCRDYEVKYRFYPFHCRKTWIRLAFHYNRPYFLLSNPARFVDRGMVSDPRFGYSGGATVLVSALQLLFFLGFQKIYVLGCDLDYQTEGKYFYDMKTKDDIHERDPHVISRRRAMVLANDDFKIARSFYEGNGRSILNAGIGGNLHVLDRVDFKSLFDSESRTASQG